MRGHEQLIAMRLDGKTPRIVFIDTAPCRHKCWRDWHVATPQSAQIEIEPGDCIPGLDMRFVFGMTVIVNGEDLARVEAAGRAAERSGATRVLTATVRRSGDRFDPFALIDFTDNLDAQTA